MSPMTSMVARSCELDCTNGISDPGHRDRHRHVEPVVRQAEERRRHPDRQVGRREIRHQLVLQLALAVLLAGVHEVAGRVVAVAVLHPEPLLVDAHPDAAESSVARGIGARIAKQVVRRGVGDDLGVDATEVVGVEERLAAGVARERDERVLARGLAVELARDTAAREHRGTAAPARLAGRPPRNDRRQAARVHGIDRHVGLDRAVDGGAQLDFIVLAALGHAAAEVDDRLLLLNRRQRVRQLLDRRQPAVGIEDVELGVVGDEAVGLGLFARSGRCRPGTPASHQRQNDRARPRALRGRR